MSQQNISCKADYNRFESVDLLASDPEKTRNPFQHRNNNSGIPYDTAVDLLNLSVAE
ncbi:MAG: hypothetical protein ACI9UN_002532 [Granulosicoccus sp.]|jgi:hypothetical protein